MITNDTKAKVKELGDTVINLSRCYAIWFELVNADKKVKENQ